MELTINDLYVIIGKLTTQNEVLKEQVRSLEARLLEIPKPDAVPQGVNGKG